MVDPAEYYRSILDNLTGGFLSVDLKGEVIYINPTAARILRLGDSELYIGKPFSFALSLFPALCDVIADALSTQKTVHRAEVRVEHAGSPLTIGYSTLQVKNREGVALGLGIIFQDLTFVRAKSP